MSLGVAVPPDILHVKCINILLALPQSIKDFPSDHDLDGLASSECKSNRPQGLMAFGVGVWSMDQSKARAKNESKEPTCNNSSGLSD